MKKIATLMIGCATAGAFAPAAHAQSQVTIYGVLDEGIMYQNNTGGAAGG